MHNDDRCPRMRDLSVSSALEDVLLMLRIDGNQRRNLDALIGCEERVLAFCYVMPTQRNWPIRDAQEKTRGMSSTSREI